MSFSIVIPARYASKRLPGKALKDINGKPMIQRVHEAALGSQASEVIVATDSEKIKEVCNQFGAECLMTKQQHRSGTDRVNEIAEILDWPNEQIIVNLQGDNALMPSENIDQVAKLLFDNPSYSIATLATNFLSKDEEEDRNAVKVFINKETNEAITFKRNLKDYDNQSVNYSRHIGIYAYTRSSLRTFSDSDPSIDEKEEKLEQLRAYGLKLRIIVGKASVTPGPDVDTYDDLLLVNSIYNKTKQ
ncbi:MAG: 3-deoxy-manno-octulosonate cytidylyltransferase [Gammaproteobacteria bacterium]|jgi:3-deoxy-manno-octulosonate cytidylyltransferase (CMP-KDO synthetase)|nr:3-deoxy-manno-octulosonate cytidylyltransferase [Gammaproteobacteria bacterium]|tara:strand:- start:706 stop:1443 length:738 start_codon:yes stop_codon:yes gene_type:complete